MAKAKLLVEGSSRAFNNWGNALKHYHTLSKQKGFVPSHVVFDVFYLADRDDPYANNLDKYALSDQELDAQGRKWTVKTITPDMLGDIGALTDLDSRDSSKQLGGMQHAVINVHYKDLWLNSNGQESRHVPQMSPPDLDTLYTMLIHMSSVGLNLVPAGTRTVSIPYRRPNSMFIDPFEGRKLTGKEAIKYWRKSVMTEMGQELRLKRYLTHQHGVDVAAMKASTVKNKELSRIFNIPEPSIRRIKQQWAKSSESYIRQVKK